MNRCFVAFCLLHWDYLPHLLPCAVFTVCCCCLHAFALLGPNALCFYAVCVFLFLRFSPSSSLLHFTWALSHNIYLHIFLLFSTNFSSPHLSIYHRHFILSSSCDLYHLFAYIISSGVGLRDWKNTRYNARTFPRSALPLLLTHF